MPSMRAGWAREQEARCAELSAHLEDLEVAIEQSVRGKDGVAALSASGLNVHEYFSFCAALSVPQKICIHLYVQSLSLTRMRP